MESFSSGLKSFAVWQLMTLIQVPIIQYGASLLKVRRRTPDCRLLSIRHRSFGAIYLLSLIISGVGFLAEILLSYLLPETGSRIGARISFVVGVAIYIWAFGYFLTDTEGASIGYWKGTQLTLLTLAAFTILFVVLVLVGLVATSIGKS